VPPAVVVPPALPPVTVEPPALDVPPELPPATLEPPVLAEVPPLLVEPPAGVELAGVVEPPEAVELTGVVEPPECVELVVAGVVEPPEGVELAGVVEPPEGTMSVELLEAVEPPMTVELAGADEPPLAVVPPVLAVVAPPVLLVPGFPDAQPSARLAPQNSTARRSVDIRDPEGSLCAITSFPFFEFRYAIDIVQWPEVSTKLNMMVRSTLGVGFKKKARRSLRLRGRAST